MLKELGLLTFEELVLQDNPEINRRHFFNQEEIDQYLEEYFQEFNFEDLNKLLSAFGFNKEELLVFFSNNKAGLLAIQPALMGGTSLDNATATFSWHMDKKSGEKIFDISGIHVGKKQKHIIAAKYEAVEGGNSYRLFSYDIGSHKEQQGSSTGILDRPSSALITRKMAEISGNKAKFHVPTGIGDVIPKGHFLHSIPNHLLIRKVAVPLK